MEYQQIIKHIGSQEIESEIKKIELQENRWKADHIVKPIIKWVGGKRSVLHQYIPYLPPVDSYNIYCEPFLGSAAMFLYLSKDLETKTVYLSDANTELINFYRVLRGYTQEVYNQLKLLPVNREWYYKIRRLNTGSLSDIERAARFLYLNKTSFNGLWRENKKGQFNVPFNNATKINISLQDMLTVSRIIHRPYLLLNVGDYYNMVDGWCNKPDSFIYLDPPYMGISRTSNFTSYLKGNFDYYEQCRLVVLVKALTDSKAKVMLSQSNSPLIRALYKDYNIHEIEAKRNINCKGNSRGAIKELLITNY